jgi:L-fuconolactonase
MIRTPVPEDPMPDAGIIDAHLHLWDPSRFRYPWLDNEPVLNRPFLLDDYNRQSAAHRIEKMVFLQCETRPADGLAEAAWISGLARQDPRIAGIVAQAPIELGRDAAAHLETLARDPLVKGVRRITQGESDPAFCLHPGFIEGVRMLERFGFSFDLCIKGDAQAENTLRLVEACPGVRFMLDHIGKPFIQQRRLEPWKSHLRSFAKMEHVWCKLSGLVVEADCDRWTPADLRPYIDHVLDCFGPNRIAFGSDWPVVVKAASLAQWIETAQAALAALSPPERRAIFHDTAARFYRLDSSPGR